MAKGSVIRSHSYNVKRRTARTVAQRSTQDDPRVIERGLVPDLIRLDVIDDHALQAFKVWNSPYGFPWHAVPRWKADDPRAIDLALWYGSGLCGMSYATPRRSKLCVKLILLERDLAVDNPLAGLVGTFLVTPLLRYAEQLECTELEVENPLPGALPLYTLLGFRYRQGQQGLRLVRSVTEE